MTDVTRSIPNPKRPRKATGRESWYPYYAGFSEEFARSLIAGSALVPGASIIDPWNGGGTTTAAASNAGFRSLGFDINPVSIVLGRARLVSHGDFLSLLPLSRIITKQALQEGFQCAPDDPLKTWFSEASANVLRSIDFSIRATLLPEIASRYLKNDVGTVSNLAAFFYLALFRTIRILLSSLKVSNPTWIKRGATVERIDQLESAIVQTFHDSVDNLSLDIRIESKTLAAASAQCDISLASSEKLPVESESIDLAISSPPYCTRIDYGVATLPELAIMGLNMGDDLRSLRESLIGTPTVNSKKQEEPAASWGNCCANFLDSVAEHESRASRSYYLKTHLQYFAGISRSLDEISRILKPQAICYLVVQDSYYKDVYNDLSSMFVEMAGHRFLSLFRREDYRVSRTMAGINTHSKRYRDKFSATESVLCFKKTEIDHGSRRADH